MYIYVIQCSTNDKIDLLLKPNRSIPPPFFPSTMKSLTCGVPTSQLLLVMSENKNNPSLIY